MGLEDVTDDPASLFDELPALAPLSFDGTAPDLEAVKESRKWKSPSLFGKGVLEICRMADIVFVALHGMNGEDGRVQATFDMLGIPYTGSGYLGAAIAMDKMLTKEMIKDKGVRTPAWKTFHAGAITSKEDAAQTAEKIASQIEAPCVVKTPTGGSSVGVYIVTSQDGIRPAVEKCLTFGPDILVEQMIDGREFTCAVLGDRALPSVEIVPKVDFYNYESKYKAGGSKGRRAIMGLSMGGGGSTVYCQRHPDMFSSCFAMSAWLDEDMTGQKPSKEGDRLYAVRKSVHEHSALDFMENADQATLEKLRSLAWFIDCGDDDFLLDLNVKFYQLMRDKKVPAQLRVRNGIHNWEYWHYSIRTALPYACRYFTL
jgi:esterase/lipase superfamily enzyme